MIAALFVGLAAGQAEIRPSRRTVLDVSVDRRPIGTIEVQVEDRPDDGPRIKWITTVKQPDGGKFFVSEDEDWSRDGLCRRLVRRVRDDAGLTESALRFEPDRVEVSGESRHLGTHPAPAGRALRRMSRIWMFAAPPTEPTVVEGSWFDLESGSWAMIREAFLGQGRLTSDGRTAAGLLFHFEPGERWIIGPDRLPLLAEIRDAEAVVTLARRGVVL
ncbi:MAG: hypothetical protein MH204_07040 [Fimbriimonadaceae bacterium]|nr:hypothetical protein [Fimbriimonadaceae bacterium]